MIDYSLFEISAHHRIAYAAANYQIHQDLLNFVRHHGMNLEAYDSIRNVNRKIEWLTIRYLLLLINPQKEDVYYDSYGKPHFKNSKNFLSISHSNEMVAVSIDQKATTGIDIQRITDKIIRIKEKFLNPKEQQITSNDPLELTYYWSIKEALFKIYGKKDAFLKENFEIVEIDFTDSSKGKAIGLIKCNNQTSKHQLEIKRIGNYVMAYAVNP